MIKCPLCCFPFSKIPDVEREPTEVITPEEEVKIINEYPVFAVSFTSHGASNVVVATTLRVLSYPPPVYFCKASPTENE